MVPADPDAITFGFDAGKVEPVFSVGNGVVHNLEVDVSSSSRFVAYRIRIQVTQNMTADYEINVDGDISDNAQRANMLVSVGDTVTAGQLIGTLPLWALTEAESLDVNTILATAEDVGYDLTGLRPRLEQCTSSTAEVTLR